jgi:tRNA pseudouridine55 synthase
MEPQRLAGFLVLDKPAGPTSRAVVNHVQQWFPSGTRIGHAGTLDPLATGVLVVAVGAATRLVCYVQAMPKTYEALLRLGQTSDTDDAGGKVREVDGAGVPTLPQVQQCLKSLVGVIDQVPPDFSAVKHRGRRAYKLARRGEAVSLEARRVHIFDIAVRRYTYPHLELEVTCGKGTYIRSLARDIGQKLGCGGMVEELRRSAIGKFTLGQALSLESDMEEVRVRFLPIEAGVTNLPPLELDASTIEQFRLGQRVKVQDRGQGARGQGPAGTLGADSSTSTLISDHWAIFGESGALIGIGIVEQEGFLRPIKVL